MAGNVISERIQNRESQGLHRSMVRRAQGEAWEQIEEIIDSDGFVNCGGWTERQRNEFVKDPMNTSGKKVVGKNVNYH